VLRLSKLIAVENANSRRNAKRLLAELAELAGPDGLGEEILLECESLVLPGDLAARARNYDLTIVPAYGEGETQAVVEGLVFGSGRPVLILAGEGSRPRFDRLLIGWDGSRAAARALADALPFCRTASSVRLVQILGEKDLGEASGLANPSRHLSRHGIDAESSSIEARGRDAGAALLRHCEETSADLLVIGAYGHSRAREFVLGGATRSVLADAALPVLLSH